ncbi:hypothetical protein RB195_011662 [Necator americanus]|uniref:Uncharacterized protein n=1 Tax=Necator americanus TaxID=51031 RepID=A0ABR1D3G9_NECAM
MPRFEEGQTSGSLITCQLCGPGYTFEAGRALCARIKEPTYRVAKSKRSSFKCSSQAVGVMTIPLSTHLYFPCKQPVEQSGFRRSFCTLHDIHIIQKLLEILAAVFFAPIVLLNEELQKPRNCYERCCLKHLRQTKNHPNMRMRPGRLP